MNNLQLIYEFFQQVLFKLKNSKLLGREIRKFRLRDLMWRILIDE